MKAILVTKRFNPGHLSHLLANDQLLVEQGFAVKYSVHRQYSSFSDFISKASKVSLIDLFLLRKNDLYIIWFPSISVVFELFLVRLFSYATVVYVYHEPYTSFKSYRVAGFSRLKTVRVTCISFVSRLICALAHKIILPSSRAFNAVPEAKHLPDRFAKLNLMFLDESSSPADLDSRIYLSYIGTIAEDHAFDDFICLMEASINAKVLLPFKFLIATPSEIPQQYSIIISKCLSLGRLFIHSGIPMTNNQINRFYNRSFLVWNAYRRSMQSGVLPKAYMFGTPVLVSSNNISEYFEDGVHGIEIPNHCSLNDFCYAVLKLKSSWLSISQNCRKYYLENFDYRSISPKFINFVTL